MRFRTRIFLGILLSNAILFLSIYFFSIPATHNVLSDRAQTYTKSLAEFIAYTAKEPIIVSDTASLDALIKHISAHAHIEGITVKDESGVVLTKYTDLEYIKHKKLNDPTLNTLGRAKIEIAGETVGFVDVVTNNQALEETKDSILEIVYLTVPLILLASLIISVFLSKWLSGPLTNVTKALQHIAQGELGYKVDRGDNKGEVGKIVEQFNAMSSQLEEMYVQIMDKERFVTDVIDSAADPVIVLDEKGVIQMYNYASENIFGYKKDEVIGKSINLLMPRSMGELHDKIIRNYMSEEEVGVVGKPREISVNPLRKNGEAFPAEISISTIDTGNGQIMVGIVRDITKRKEVEDSLEASRLQAEEASHMKTQFLANMSHELRTPMNSVIGLSSLLLETPRLSKEQQKLVKGINSSGEVLLSLINDILDVSKVEVDALKLEKRAFSLSTLLDMVISANKFLAENKGISLDLVTDIDEDFALCGDQVRLTQIFMNLISNAIKFTTEGGVTVNVTCKKSTGKNKAVLHAFVKDTGVGIAGDKLNYIFESFSQADESVTREFGGTGLGLSICKSLVELMGGQIGVESTKGQGSCFLLSIPFEITDASEVVENVVTSWEQGCEVKGKVLLVDDHPMNLELLERLVVKFGVKDVEKAVNGEEAVEKILSDNFDLVLMDCQMPLLGGLQATEQVRKAEQDKHTPIVAMTANASMEYRDKCLEGGMDAYLTKPVRKEQLIPVLKKWLLDGIEQDVDLPKKAKKKKASSHKKNKPASIQLDMDYLTPLLEDDRDFVAHLFNSFFASSDDILLELKTSLDEKDVVSWQDRAHKLKGAALNIGATKVSDLSAVQEEAKPTAKALKDIQGEITKLKKGWKAFLGIVEE